MPLIFFVLDFQAILVFEFECWFLFFFFFSLDFAGIENNEQHIRRRQHNGHQHQQQQQHHNHRQQRTQLTQQSQHPNSHANILRLKVKQEQ